jgi:hypothetical protein
MRNSQPGPGRFEAAGWPALVVVAWLAMTAPAAVAHPLSQGALDVTVQRDRVTVRARVTQEEVAVTNMMVAPAPGEPEAEYARHAAYLSRHVRVSADGAAWAAVVTKVTPPGQAGGGGSGGGGASPSPRPDQHAVYEIEYRPPTPAPAGGSALAASPARVELRQDVLVGVSTVPGWSWEASYLVTFRQQGGRAVDGLLLTNRDPVDFACDWPAAATPGSAAAGGPPVADGPPQQAQADRWRVVVDFVAHGVHHILTGYDHLLFVSALVLAAVTFWDLLKVVTAFTLAHTLTLTLSALDVVRLPSGIVEPLIAASIVVVAAQNVFWPRRSRGWSRLAAAFFFGLFHGLGFAGGLLEAMDGTGGGATLLLAIAAFSLGVEVGHQAVVIPLFAALRLARRTRIDVAARDRVSLLVQRYGSAAISVAGMVYLVLALESSLASAKAAVGGQ